MADNFTQSLQKVLKFSNLNLSLAKGLHEVTKALECDEKPLFVVMAEDCDEARYKTLVEALCKQYKVPLLKVPKREQLGAMAGQCQFLNADQPKNVVKCSSVAVKSFS